MEGGRTEQEYDELDILLGEIPSATSGNPHTEESRPNHSSDDLGRTSLKDEGKKCSPSGTYTDFYQGPQGTSPSSSKALYSSLSFERTKTGRMNPSQDLINDELQTSSSLDGTKMNVQNGYQSSIKIANSDVSNLPDDQSLTSAFAGLSFKDAIPMGAVNPHIVSYTELAECPFLLDGQYPDCSNKRISCLNSGGVVIPPSHSPSALHGINMLGSMPNGFNKFNMEVNGQESTKFLKPSVEELKKQKLGSCQPIENLKCDSGERLQSIPVYSGTMPLAHGMHAFQVLSSVPVSGMEFSVPPYEQYFIDQQSSHPYMQSQQLSQSHITWRQMEEEQYRRMHQQCLYLQQLRDQQAEVQYPLQTNGSASIRPITRNRRQPYFEMPVSSIEQPSREPFWNNSAITRGLDQSALTLVGSDLCSYYNQGSHGRGENCSFSHGPKRTSISSLAHNSAVLSSKDFDAIEVLDKVGKQNFPEKILTRSHGLNSLRDINKTLSVGGHDLLNHSNCKGRILPNGHFYSNHPSILNAGFLQQDGRSSRGSSPDTTDLRHNCMRLQPQKYISLDEVTGRIYLMAKDQNGCRFLQKKFSEGTAEDVEKIFVEIIGHIVELMTDPFGNYLVQKLLEVCNEDQRMQILHVITLKAGDLVRISCDMHGTRAVQKVIETLKTPEQFSLVVSSLKPGIVILIKDMNGNHVAQRCLQYLSSEYSEFLFEAATMHCVELATDRHGCCVLQKCLGHSDGEQRRHLICEITSNALILSQDQFGNYVVQYVFELHVPWATANVLDQLEGNYIYLSMQKYSSNVVEKCLKYAGEEQRARIIQELINGSQLDQILLDPYGNYVIQSALNHSKGALHAALVEAIRPHVPSLRTNPYGKKVLSSNSLKK